MGLSSSHGNSFSKLSTGMEAAAHDKNYFLLLLASKDIYVVLAVSLLPV